MLQCNMKVSKAVDEFGTANHGMRTACGFR